MSETPDIRPVGDLPHELGKTAPRELHHAGINSLADIAKHTRKELLAIHGVGPKAIRIPRTGPGCQRLVFQGGSVMSRIIYETATSIDGYIADENNSLDWLFVVPGGESPDPELTPPPGSRSCDGLDDL